MKPQKSELARSVDRFVTDIADIIRRHAERVVAEALARHGLSPATRGARGVRKAKAAPAAQVERPAKARAGDAAPASTAPNAAGPRSQRRPEQLPLFR